MKNLFRKLQTINPDKALNVVAATVGVFGLAIVIGSFALAREGKKRV